MILLLLLYSTLGSKQACNPAAIITVQYEPGPCYAVIKTIVPPEHFI